MSAYCLFDNVLITDPDAIAEYARLARPTVEAHGGRYLVLGGDTELKEGDWQPTYPVMIEFPSLEAANAWYESPEYAPLRAKRLGAGQFNAVFIDGLTPG